MHYLFIMLILLPLFAIVLASVYMTARHYMARRACYRRASLGSLVHSARKAAIVRHFGRGGV